MASSISLRNFSVANKTTTAVADKASGSTTDSESSIFASADYFKDAKIEQEAISADISSASSVTATADTTSTTSSGLMEKVDHLMWMDANDSLGTTMALAAKDVENLV